MFEKRKKYLTVKNEMFLLGFIFLIAVSLLFAGIFLKLLYDNNMESAKNSLRECNSQIVTFTEGLFHENATVIEMLVRDESIVNAGYGNPDSIISIFDAIHERNTNITYIYSGYSNGSLYINNYDTPQDFNATERPWYKAAASTDGVARLVYRDAVTGVWLFSQSMKIVDDSGKMVGVMCIDSSNESISRQLSARYRYSSQRSFIVDQQGTILIHPEEEKINQSMSDRVDVITWNEIVSGRNNYAEYGKDGINAMAYFERIPQTDFFIVTSIDAAEVNEPIVQGILYLFLLSAVVSVLMGMFLCRILIGRFARPIMELGERIQNLAEGRTEETKYVYFSNREINGIAESIEVIVKDIANREEKRKSAEYLSLHDSMTGLYNRRFFEMEMRRLDAEEGCSFGLISCDINGLKLVNDVFGHIVGDRLINVVAECLVKGSLAEYAVARIGGDEFAVIIPGGSETEAQKATQRIKEQFPHASISGVEVSVSMGYAVRRSREQFSADIVRIADEMMYEQKIKESTRMKRWTVNNIIMAAEKESYVHPITEQENCILTAFAEKLCPDSAELLLESYRLRKIGLCSIVSLDKTSNETLYKSHTEIGYRILSAVDDYRSVAGCVLHYMERWDGSGWPAGLSGMDIPLLSRIIAVTEAYVISGHIADVREKSNIWYDPELVRILLDNLS